MNFMENSGHGYVPTYTRTIFTNALHEMFGFRTDYEIVTNKELKKIQKFNRRKWRYSLFKG